MPSSPTQSAPRRSTGARGRFDPAIETVEFKVTVRADQQHIVWGELERANLESERRKVYFFDTPDLRLVGAGVVLRARISHDGTDDSTVKLRPVVPAEIGRRWRRTSGFEIELDMVGDQPVCSAKLAAEQRRDEIDEVAAGRRSMRKLFSRDQERLIAEYGPIGIAWDELSVLGPVAVRKWKLPPVGFPREITVERWTLPGASDLVELSIRVKQGKAAKVGAAFRDFLSDRGLESSGDHQSKTRAALTLFTGAA